MSTALIPLSKGKKSLVSFGAIMLTVAVACYGLALMNLVPPILERLDGMSYAGLVGLCISLGITLMSPIGGKLGDIFGRKAVVVIAGLVNLICGIGIAFAPNVLILLICCFGVGFSQGAYVSAPYIIMGLINEKKNVPKAMGYLTMALAIGGTGGSILAGILTQLMLYSVNLVILGGESLMAVDHRANTLLVHMSNNPMAIVTMIAMVTLTIIILWLFFYTEVGLTLKSTGDNPDMSRAQGVDVNRNKVIGLAIANGIVAMAGAMLAQYKGSANINDGRGAIVIALAAIFIGLSV